MMGGGLSYWCYLQSRATCSALLLSSTTWTEYLKGASSVANGYAPSFLNELRRIRRQIEI